MDEIIVCTDRVNVAEVVKNQPFHGYSGAIITETCASEEALVAALARLAQRRSGKREKFFTIKAVGGAQMRPFSDIVYCASEGHRYHVYLAGGERLVSSNARCCFAESMAPLLEDCRFVQCSRSVVVNTNFIRCVCRDTVELYGGELLPLPIHRQAEFKKMLETSALSR